MQRIPKAPKPTADAPGRRLPAGTRSGPAAPATTAQRRPQAAAQRELMQAIAQGSRLAAQRGVNESMNSGPRTVAQRQRLRHLFGPAAQRQGAVEIDPPGQRRPAAAQPRPAEEDPPMQGRFDAAPRHGPRDSMPSSVVQGVLRVNGQKLNEAMVKKRFADYDDDTVAVLTGWASDNVDDETRTFANDRAAALAASPPVGGAEVEQAEEAPAEAVPELPNGWQKQGATGLAAFAAAVVLFVLGDAAKDTAAELAAAIEQALPEEWTETDSKAKQQKGQKRHEGAGGAAYRASNPAVQNKAAVYAATHAFLKTLEVNPARRAIKESALAKYVTLKTIKDKQQVHNM